MLYRQHKKLKTMQKLIKILGTLAITLPFLKSLKTYFWRVHSEIKINTSTVYAQAERPVVLKSCAALTKGKPSNHKNGEQCYGIHITFRIHKWNKKLCPYELNTKIARRPHILICGQPTNQNFMFQTPLFFFF